ncbi:MAG TPA: NBR1-Ig-like domain-containing protein [Anaerolineales bacterium]|nr:NBR1-Ig-like domain-containing protein [Anaerolineales bacterium]
MFRHKFLSIVMLGVMLFSQAVPHAMAATLCDSAQFISDLSVPDGSAFVPGAAFTKTWRLQNNGTCTWDTSYSLVWAGGDSMGTNTSVKLPVSVPPGQMLDISINLTAPAASGHYKSLWKLSNAAGVQFGIGESASDPFWVDINVIDNSAVVYDFVANAPYAQWKSGAGILPYPGASGDSRGYSFQVNNPHLEDDSFDSAPGLLTVPQNKYNGYIQAAYPEFQVQSGDRLQTLVNCEFGATGCYVTFRIDYLLPNGVQKTFWTWKEAHDKRFYRANLDLTPLAGQKVRFVFMLLSSGLAGGDRAIWGSPRIVRTGSTQPPAPPSTLTPLPPLTPTATPITPPPPTPGPAGCDRATFVSDVTVQDGTIFAPGAAFTKTWRLKNSGACMWTTAYKLIYYSGEQMSAPTSVNLPWGAANGQTVDISVNMVAPAAAGKYRGFWILANARGQYFGIGTNAADPIWVEINVAGDSARNTASYDFLANACSAQWKSGAGILPCPGTDGDSKGFVLQLNPARLEDGTASAPGLLTFPQNRYNGYIQGLYPAFTVQPGDRFQSSVSCEQGSNCHVTFRLDYMLANGYIGTFWQWRELNDGKYYAANVDLTPLTGRSVRFILTILATGYATGDRAIWAAPRIVRAAGGPPTITPVPSDWLTYTNQQFNFKFNYPPQAQIVNQSPAYLKMNLPFTPGTNLVEKYLETIVVENPPTCRSPLATSSLANTSETVVINGISFLKETGGDGGVGHLHEWEAYSTLHNNACISMDFVLHSLNPGGFSTPPPVFDKAAESAVFMQIMSTFAWTTPTITSVPPTATFTPTPSTGSGTVVPSPLIQKLFMQDASNGWAIGNPYVLRTMDGGATWYNVTAPGVASVQNAFFQNSSKGWALATLADSGMPALFRTTSGGSTWTSYSNLPFNGGYLQFLDDMNGFVLSGEPSGMQRHAVQLYQTSDGGATWTLKYANDPSQPNNSLPFSGHKNGMAFHDTGRGWVGGDIPTPGFVYLYRTENSGVSWSQQPLALPAGYGSAGITTTAPSFFGPNDAVLPVWMGLDVGKRDLYLYVTHDAGTTWTHSTGFARMGRNTDILSVRDAFSWNEAGFIHVTNDSGANWRQVTPNVNFGESIRDMDFVSASTGWMLDVGDNGNIALYRTADGGATWTLLFGNTSTPTQTPSPAATATPSPADYAQTIVNTLSAKDFNGAKSLMDQSFAMAFWQSQGTSLTPDEAVQQLQLNYIGPSTVLVPDPNEDLTALLGGSNPYSIMGLDSSNSRALFVSGWGLDGKGEAILYVTKRADGSLYWHSVLIAPTGFAPPVTLTGPYAVVRLAPNDVLNIRSGAGVSQPVVGSFAADAVNVMRTGPTASADNATWVEVQNPNGGTGWVNSSYLTEYVTHEAFCADTRIPALIEQLKGSMNQSNGDLFSALVSPVHGVNVNLWAYQPPVSFNTTTSRNVFTSTEVYDWGAGPRGEPDLGTFAQIIQPKMQEVFNAPNMETYCDNLTNVYPLTVPWPYTNVRYYNLYKPGTPGTELDFRTWLIGFEYINGQPTLYAMVTIPWEP